MYFQVPFIFHVQDFNTYARIRQKNSIPHIVHILGNAKLKHINQSSYQDAKM